VEPIGGGGGGGNLEKRKVFFNFFRFNYQISRKKEIQDAP